MSKSKTNRREFLKITGASLTGLALVSAVGIPQAIAKEPSLRSKESMEQWLLNTGADELPPNLFNDVLQKLS
jgi:DMSO/TMAO reductase YedYZ molybdopterin-dependent catalytic subunit